MAESVLELGKKARAAALEMAVCGIEERNNALLAMANALIAHKAQILAGNEAGGFQHTASPVRTPSYPEAGPQ